MHCMSCLTTCWLTHSKKPYQGRHLCLTTPSQPLLHGPEEHFARHFGFSGHVTTCGFTFMHIIMFPYQSFQPINGIVVFRAEQNFWQLYMYMWGCFFLWSFVLDKTSCGVSLPVRKISGGLTPTYSMVDLVKLPSN